MPTATDVEIAVGILIADVSSAKHSVSKCESRILRVVPIASHDVRAPGDQFAVVPDFHFFSRFVFDSQINSRTRAPARKELAFDMLLIFETCEEAGLAEAIGLKKFHAGQKLSRSTDKFRRNGRTAVNQNLEAAQVVRLRLRHLGQQAHHRRHKHRVSYALALH